MKLLYVREFFILLIISRYDYLYVSEYKRFHLYCLNEEHAKIQNLWISNYSSCFKLVETKPTGYNYHKTKVKFLINCSWLKELHIGTWGTSEQNWIHTICPHYLKNFISNHSFLTSSTESAADQLTRLQMSVLTYFTWSNKQFFLKFGNKMGQSPSVKYLKTGTISRLGT